MRRFRRRQWLAIDHADDPRDAGANAAGEVAALELRRYILVDDALGGDVGERAFEAVADLDAQMPVILGDHQQRAVIDLLAPDLPGLGNADRELLDGFRLRRRHDQDRDLAAFARFQAFQGLRQRSDVVTRQSPGLIDHPSRELWHRDVSERRKHPAQQQRKQDRPCSVHRGQSCCSTSTGRPAPGPD